MAKFNQAGIAPVHVIQSPTTLTYEGAPSFEMDMRMELYQTVVTTLFGEPTFYEGKDKRAKRISRLVEKCVKTGHAEFVAKLAIYAREQMNLRSISIFLTVTLLSVLRGIESAEFGKGRALVGAVIQRADEIREMFAAGEKIFGDPSNTKTFKRVMPAALKRGIADAFNKFDAYQFRKYQAGKGSIKFTDVMRVVHPTPKDDEQSIIFKQIMEGTLPQIETWETKISNEGSTTKNWQAIADSPKTGYMAKLRNLRNFVKHDVNLAATIEHLSNPHAIARSRQLPFRFYTAYRELGGETLKSNFYNYGYEETGKTIGSPELLAALEDIFDLSVVNLPDMGDDVLIVVDQSGSMLSPISSKSSVVCAEIAGVLGAAVWSNQVVNLGKRAMVVGFACKGKVYTWSKRTSALSAAKQMMNTDLGASTRINTAWQSASDAGLKPSTIIVLSDMQLTGSYHDREMKPEAYGLVGPDTLKISVNINSYGNTPLAVNNGWYQIAGWSEKVFDLIKAMRNPSDATKLIIDSVDL